MLDGISDNLDQNLARVENLVVTYETHPDAQGSGRKPADLLDILRAAVVLLHASLEDMLRSLANWKLPAADAQILDAVPLVGQGSNPKRFLLGELAAHRGKRVEDVLAESVREHLKQSNYNSVGEVASLLESIKIKVAKVNSRFADLAELMERRHQIVHRADRQEKVKGSGDHEIRAINKNTVRTWAGAVKEFGAAVLAAV